jgi:hypothetical protein
MAPLGTNNGRIISITSSAVDVKSAMLSEAVPRISLLFEILFDSCSNEKSQLDQNKQ